MLMDSSKIRYVCSMPHLYESPFVSFLKFGPIPPRRVQPPKFFFYKCRPIVLKFGMYDLYHIRNEPLLLKVPHRVPRVWYVSCMPHYYESLYVNCVQKKARKFSI